MSSKPPERRDVRRDSRPDGSSARTDEPATGITLRYVAGLLLLLAGATGWALMSQTPGPGKAEARVSILPPPDVIKTPTEREFEQKLEEIGAGLKGEVGIAVVDVATGRVYEFNGDAILPQQSVSKLWVSLAALGKVDRGKLDLSERVTIRRQDLTLFYQPLREIVRTRGQFDTDYLDLMIRALSRSDNSANDRLLRRVGGPDAVEDWIKDHDLAGVRFGTDERSKQSAIAGLDWQQAYSYANNFHLARDQVPLEERRDAFERYLAEPIDGASPTGIALALAKLARGELLSPASTRLVRDILSTTKSGPRRIKAGAPEGWEVDHKTGTGQEFGGEQSGYNDVGIVTAPDGHEYAIAVMIGRTRESIPARMAMMQAVTRATAAFHDAQEAG